MGMGLTSIQVNQGESVIVTGTFTRPNDANVYGIGDVINNSVANPPAPAAAISFLNAARNPGGGGVMAPYWKLTKSDVDIVNASFRLWLFLGVPGVIPFDNDPLAWVPFADRAIILGYVDFTVWTVGADGAYSIGVPQSANMPFNLPAGSTTLYGQLEARAAYVPLAVEIFHVLFGVFQD